VIVGVDLHERKISAPMTAPVGVPAGWIARFPVIALGPDFLIGNVAAKIANAIGVPRPAVTRPAVLARAPAIRLIARIDAMAIVPMTA
jgi:hypothetical protein